MSCFILIAGSFLFCIDFDKVGYFFPYRVLRVKWPIVVPCPLDYPHALFAFGQLSE